MANERLPGNPAEVLDGANEGQSCHEMAPDDLRFSMTPEQQLAFWTALGAPVELTSAQKALGKVMRGDS